MEYTSICLLYPTNQNNARERVFFEFQESPELRLRWSVSRISDHGAI